MPECSDRTIFSHATFMADKRGSLLLIFLQFVALEYSFPMPTTCKYYVNLVTSLMSHKVA